MMRQMLGTALVALVLAACAGARGGASAGDAPPSLAGTSWVLTELDGRAPAAGVTTPTLEFEADRVNGNGGCNLFNGPYTQDGASLRMGPLVATRRACVEEAGNAQETAYFRALESTTSAAIADGMLELSDDSGVVARFRPAP